MAEASGARGARGPSFYLAIAGAAIAMALAGVYPLVWVFHAHLPWWLHLPLAGVLLTVVGGLPAVAAVGLCEWRVRQKLAPAGGGA